MKNEKTGAEVYLVGTLHISRRSAEQVREVINHIKPEAVMIELDAFRAQKLMEKHGHAVGSLEHARALIPPGAIPSGFPSGAYILEELLKKFYSFFRLQGIIPGMEFLVGMEEAERLGCEVILGDRNSQVQDIFLWLV
uniref:TraB family protein n=1 Tax=Arcella intermedia TaxID=1963864 RepID=A0A6B2LPU1_9EUKA